MTYIKLILDNNTTNINPHLLSEHDNQIILEKIETRENFNHDEYVEDENYHNVDIYNYENDDN